MRKRVIGVMGPAEKVTEVDRKRAFLLGKLVAKKGWVLLTGGRASGIMDAASCGAKKFGGLTVGILPAPDSRKVSRWVDIAVFTDMGMARNNINVLSSDVVIACGALTPGTLSEVALTLKAGKQVVLLGGTKEGRAFIQKTGGAQVSIASSPAAAVRQAEKILA